MVRVLINVPRRVMRGESFPVKILISHPMESGQRHDDMGRPVPRDIIHHLTASLDGETIVEIDLFPAISANPFFNFYVTAEKNGILAVAFTGDNGLAQLETVSIEVT